MKCIRRRVVRRIHSVASRAGAALLMLGLGASSVRAQAARVERPPAASGDASLTAATASGPLLLGELYRDARRSSPKVAAARALAEAERARVPGTRRPPDPTLQLGFMNYSLPGLEPMEPLGMVQLQLTQIVPTAGKLRLAGRAASARASAQLERAVDVEWTVRRDVAMVFYELYAVEQSLAVDRQTLRLVRDIRQIAEARYRVGEGGQTDVLQANVEIARMTEDTIRLTAIRESMGARLNALLDRPGDAPVGSPRPPRFPDSVPALPELLGIAAGSRAMVQAGAREVDAAKAEAALARRAIWPDLMIGLQYGQSRLTMPAEGGAGGTPLPSARRTEHMGSVMIGASLPIFARSRQLRSREEMTAMRRVAEADLAAMLAETRGGVVEAHANLLRARRLAELYRTTVVPQAEATVESSLAAYRVGSVDFMTLLDNRMAVNRYRQELLVLTAEEGKAWAELEMLLGRELLDPDQVTTTLAREGR